MPEGRPSPQELLRRIEALMPKHEDVMRSWGTVEWFEQQEREAGRIEEEETEEGAPLPGSPAGTKRKRDAEEDEMIRQKRRAMSERVTKRRKDLVGKQMSEGRNKDKGPPTHVSPDDDRFILAEDLKMFYIRIDPLFDVEKYFSTPASRVERYIPERETWEAGHHPGGSTATSGLERLYGHQSADERTRLLGHDISENEEDASPSFLEMCCGPLYRLIGRRR